MSSVTKLITAMHAAAGETAGTCSAWIELAQQHHMLLEALHAVFGKRMPTPNKLGLWLSERVGQSAGELILHGHHSARKKAWVYRVATAARLEQIAVATEEKRLERETRNAAELARLTQKEAERAERRAQHQASKPPPSLRIQRLAPDPIHSPPSEPPLNREYLTRTVNDGDGRQHEEYVRDRDGQPIPRRETPTVAPEPVVEVATSKPDDPRPWWLQRGELKPRDREEWQAWQDRRLPRQARHEDKYTTATAAGFADPAGIVSYNQNREDYQREPSTFWDGTLKNL